MHEQDSLPWYKQFWPWFLILLPGSAVVASLYTVSLAVRTTDSLVTASDAGMDVVAERHLAAENSARALGLVATIVIDRGSGAVHATLAGDSISDVPDRLELLLSHPTRAERDVTATLHAAIRRDGVPAWTGHVLQVPAGRWYVVLTPAGDARDAWRLNGVWTGQPSLRLLPGSGASDEPT